MGRLRDVGLVVIAALACDPVVREAAPEAMASPMAAPATAAEKAARKQARAEKKAGKIARGEAMLPDGRKKAGGKQAKAKQAQAKAKAKEAKAKVVPSSPSPTAPGGPPLPPCPPENVLTWRSFGAGFLLTWCTGCHSSALAEDARQGAPPAVDFDTYARYKPFERLVYERAVTEAHAIAVDPDAAASPMPPAGLVPAADRERLAQWIACGSPAPN
ncbi:hypothetical protein [Nannocystis pusilla]|uniref:hypothetical protein n=1 Tax=Nannocystis pusilla TaxID=889268 RepID=UPI003DA436DA